MLATVVWRRAPSSGKAGATALITADRAVHGWIGGACAEPTVVREAMRAIEEGTPRLLFLGPPEELEAHARDGVVSVPIACQSEGALEVYVEPVLPQPQLVAVGRSPAALALTRLALAALRWRTLAVDDGGNVDDHDADAVIDIARPRRRRRPLLRGRRHPGPLRRGRPRASAGDARRATSGSSHRRSAPKPCSATCATGVSPTSARAGARARRPRPRPHRERRDRGGDPGRDRAAAGRRRARRPAAAVTPEAARGDRPGVRHDRRRRRRPLPRLRTPVARSTSAPPGASRRSSTTRPASNRPARDTARFVLPSSG